MYNLTVRDFIILCVNLYAFLIMVKELSEPCRSCGTFYKCAWTVFTLMSDVNMLAVDYLPILLLMSILTWP
jgi:hypothetical protein